MKKPTVFITGASNGLELVGNDFLLSKCGSGDAL